VGRHRRIIDRAGALLDGGLAALAERLVRVRGIDPPRPPALVDVELGLVVDVGCVLSR
jgi:hypothetical protein